MTTNSKELTNFSSASAITEVVTVEDAKLLQHNAPELYLTVYIGNARLGIPILQIQSVLTPQDVTPIPLADSAFLGLMNMRGRVVTVISLANVLENIHSKPRDPKQGMHIVIEEGHDLFSLFVDRVGDVIEVMSENKETPPPTMSRHWRQYVRAVCKLKGELMVLLDTASILTLHNDQI